MPEQIIQGQYSTNNAVKLVRSGKEYFSLLEQLIDSAEQTIHLQVYIFSADDTGKTITEALIRAVKRGVNVYVMADDYASDNLPREYVQYMRDSGIWLRRFEPFFKNKNFYFGRRLHHKVVVVDAYSALVGGLNIADRYNDLPDYPAWLDVALYVEGDAARELEQVCCDVWNRNYDKKKRIPSCVNTKKLVTEELDESVSVRVRINDWLRRKNQVWRSYFDIFNNANESIVVVCSYFLPGRVYRNRLVKAVQRGVNVKLVLASKSDVMIAKYAERFLYDWLLRNNIELYEYEKNILHAKFAVQDGKYMTIGSYNVNEISALVSVELNLDVRNKPFVSGVQKTIDNIIKEDCVQITPANHKATRNPFKIFFQRCAYELVKLMFFAVTFYYKQERD
jgi:cardiolipin synthase